MSFPVFTTLTNKLKPETGKVYVPESRHFDSRTCRVAVTVACRATERIHLGFSATVIQGSPGEALISEPMKHLQRKTIKFEFGFVTGFDSARHNR